MAHCVDLFRWAAVLKVSPILRGVPSEGIVAIPHENICVLFVLKTNIKKVAYIKIVFAWNMPWDSKNIW